jgi:hypothetical protein
MDRNALLSLLFDISGKSKLESEDPRWSMLFRTKAYAPKLISTIDMKQISHRMRSNNLSTGNFLQLMDQVTARVKQTLSVHTKPNRITIEQCCSAISILNQLFHHLIPTMTSLEIRQQLALSNDWPRDVQEHTKRHIDGDAIVRTYLETLMAAVDAQVDS